MPTKSTREACFRKRLLATRHPIIKKRGMVHARTQLDLKCGPWLQPWTPRQLPGRPGRFPGKKLPGKIKISGLGIKMADPNVLDCGCVVENWMAPIVLEDKNLGCVFVSRCEKHSAKVDSRKATPGTEFAFTLTMPPDYKPNKTVLETAKLIMKNGLTADKPYEKASQWAIVLEHTDKGTPHVHGVYKTESGRRISAKYFKRYWDLWDEKVKLGAGHKGGYHAKARHSESYAAYLEKEGVVINGLNNQTGELNSPE